MKSQLRSRGIVVAGMGVVTPLGLDLPTTWKALLGGRSGIGRIEIFDAAGLGVRIAGEVPDCAPYDSGFLGRRAASRREHFAFRALDEALWSAGIDPRELGGTRTGIFTGCERENTTDLRLFSEYEDEGRDPVGVALRHRRDLYQRQPDAIARTILGRTPSATLVFNYTMACAAGAVAAHEAIRWLRRGTIQRALVVAADTPITPPALHGFDQLGALSANNDAPTRACRPFDQARDGFVLAEGAGALVLETPALAAMRGHRGVGSILGAGMTNNQYHITKTPPAGEHAAQAMRWALSDAGLEPADIGYINAHGTSTDVGDAGEVAAIRSVFGASVPTSSTKSMTGHMVAASGIVEAIVALMAVRDGWLPPTINLEDPDPVCELDCVPNVARERAVEYSLSNSFGFGGTNVSLVLGGVLE